MFRSLITIATVLYLALVAQSPLQSIFAPPPSSPGPISVEVVERDDAGPVRNYRRLLVTGLIVDGRSVRLDTLDRSQAWKIHDIVSGLPVQLEYDRNSEPAVLNFRGTRFVMVLQPANWSGVIRVKRGGSTVQVIDTPDGLDREFRVLIEDPQSSSSPWLFILPLLLFGGLAVWLGPVRPERKSLPWLAGFLSLLHLMYWSTQTVGTTNDSMGYLECFNGFLWHGFPCYYPPGYGLLLGLLGGAANSHLGLITTFVQHGMAVAAAIWIYLLLRRFTGEGTAFLGGVLAGALPPMLNVPQGVISETLTLFGIIGAVYFAVRAKESGKSLYGVLAGVLAGWATLARVAPAFPLVPAFILIYLWQSPISAFKQRLRPLSYALGSMAIFLLIPLSWAWIATGHAQLSTAAGRHFFDRFVSEQKLVDENGPAYRQLLSITGGKDPRNFFAWEVPFPADFPPAKMDSLLRSVAMEGVYRSPGSVIPYTLNLTWRDFIAPTDWIPIWGDTIPYNALLENAPPLPYTAAAFDLRARSDEANARIWPVLCWASILGLVIGLLTYPRPLVAVFACIPAGILMLSAAVEIFCPRYNAPVVPFICALALLPLDFLLRKMPNTLIVRGFPAKSLESYPAGAVFARVAPWTAAVAGFLQGIFFALSGPFPYRLLGAVTALVSLLIAIGSIRNRDLKRLIASFVISLVPLAVFCKAIFDPQSPAVLRGLAVAILLVNLTLLIAILLAALRVMNPIAAIRAACLLAAAAFLVEFWVSPPEPVLAQRVEVRLESPQHAAAAMNRPNQSVRVGLQGSPKTIFTPQSHWVLLMGSHSSAHLVPSGDTGHIRVVVDRLGKQDPAYVQPGVEHFRVKTNTRYRLTFRAKADSAREMFVGCARAHGDWGGLGFYAKVSLTTEWQDFTYDFQATQDDDNAHIHFDLNTPALHHAAVPVEIADLHINLPDGRFLVPDAPSGQGAYQVNYVFNSVGCRGPEYAIPKPSATNRVLVLGNAEIMGYGVPAESALAQQLAARLAPSDPHAEVLNCGVPGGLKDQVRFYESTLMRYQPNTLILGLSWNDYTAASSAAFGLEPPRKPELLFHSWGAIRERARAAQLPDYSGVDSAIRQLAKDCAGNGSRLVVFIFRNNTDIRGNTASGRAWNQLAKTVQDSIGGTDTPIIDLGTLLDRDGSGQAILAHAAIPIKPNEFAHAKAADALLPIVKTGASQLSLTPDHSNGVYNVGDTVGWTVESNPAKTASLYKYTILRNNAVVLRKSNLALSSGKVRIEIRGDQPEMLYLAIEPVGPGKFAGGNTGRDDGIYAAGAAVAPTQIAPVSKRPADFDSFWDGKLAAQAEIPMNPLLTPVERDVSGVEMYRFSVAALGSHVQGYLARPARAGSYPALIVLQAAGVYALDRRDAAIHAADGWLVLSVDAHDKDPSEPKQKLPQDFAYASIGNTDRDQCYFVKMYLRDSRALDYLITRPDWDGKTVVLTGTSQGGQQSLALAALRPDKITAVVVNVPAGADMHAGLYGRKSGFPSWSMDDPRIVRTAAYIDPINFAPRIKAPVLAAFGFIDTIAPPTGIWTLLNQIHGPKEPIPMIDSEHDTQERQGAWFARSKEVLDSLLHGRQYHPAEWQ